MTTVPNVADLLKKAKVQPATNGNGHSNSPVSLAGGGVGAGDAVAALPAIIKLTIDDLIAQLRTVAESVDQEFARDCTLRGEIGAAELFTRIARNWIAYDVDALQWHLYNGLYWQPDRGNDVKILASKTLAHAFKSVSSSAYSEKLEAEAAVIDPKNKTKEEAAKIAYLDNVDKTAHAKMKAMHDINAVKRILEFAQASSLLGVLSDVWDRKTQLLGVANGVIDLVTGAMVQPCFDQYVRTVAPVSFTPGATCPTFELAIKDIFDGNTEKIGYVQRLLGYAMSGACVESDFPIWYGKHGRNGKEFILERIWATLGESLAGPVDSELLLSSKAQRSKNGATEALMVLRGRRIAWATETNEGRSFDNATMKDLTGGHIMTGRHNHGRQEEWLRTHTIFLLTNFKPHMSGGGGDAEWERAKLLEFTQSFVDDPDKSKSYQRKKDGSLGMKIDKSELPGVLNWLIAGCLEWRNGGLKTPGCVKDATAGYRKEEDNLGAFIEENCTTEKPEKVETKDFKEALGALFIRYQTWTLDQGDKSAMGKKTFSRKMEERGFVKTKSKEGWFMSGIMLCES